MAVSLCEQDEYRNERGSVVGSDFYGATEMLGLSDDAIVARVVDHITRCEPALAGTKVCLQHPSKHPHKWKDRHEREMRQDKLRSKQVSNSFCEVPKLTTTLERMNSETAAGCGFRRAEVCKGGDSFQPWIASVHAGAADVL